jgi:adenosylhomocysteine nucleosidase
LPRAAVVGMRSDGRVNLIAVLASLLGNPRQLPDLALIARDVRRAMQVLVRCRSLLGPELGCAMP